MKNFLFLLIGGILLAGCTGNTGTDYGDSITLTYDIYFEDQTPYLTGQSLSTVLTTGINFPGGEKTLLGLKLGKTKKITLVPEDAYGSDHSINKVQQVPLIIFEKLGNKPEVGSWITLGDTFGKISSITTDEDGNNIVLFDINPRYTQENLVFHITLEQLTKAEIPQE